MTLTITIIILFVMSIAPRLVRSACDRGSYATFAIIGHRIGDKKCIISSSFVLRMIPLFYRF
jgi:hypothetical protein